MTSKLFKKFIRKSIFSKQGPPGPPPRRGLVWKPTTHRWIRPIDAVHQEIKENVAEGNTDLVDDDFPLDIHQSAPLINEHIKKVLPSLISQGYDEDSAKDYFFGGQTMEGGNEYKPANIEGGTVDGVTVQEVLGITTPRNDQEYSQLEDAIADSVEEHFMTEHGVPRSHKMLTVEDYFENPFDIQSHNASRWVQHSFQDIVSGGGKGIKWEKGKDLASQGDIAMETYDFEPLKNALRDRGGSENAINSIINNDNVRDVIKRKIVEDETKRLYIAGEEGHGFTDYGYDED